MIPTVVSWPCPCWRVARRDPSRPLRGLFAEAMIPEAIPSPRSWQQAELPSLPRVFGDNMPHRHPRSLVREGDLARGRLVASSAAALSAHPLPTPPWSRPWQHPPQSSARTCPRRRRPTWPSRGLILGGGPCFLSSPWPLPRRHTPRAASFKEATSPTAVPWPRQRQHATASPAVRPCGHVHGDNDLAAVLWPRPQRHPRLSLPPAATSSAATSPRAIPAVYSGGSHSIFFSRARACARKQRSPRPYLTSSAATVFTPPPLYPSVVSTTISPTAVRAASSLRQGPCGSPVASSAAAGPAPAFLPPAADD